MSDKKNKNPAFPKINNFKGGNVKVDKKELQSRIDSLKEAVLFSQLTSEEIASTMVKVGFDFDGTISETDFFGKPSDDFKAVREFFLELKERGFDVRIITRRFAKDFKGAGTKQEQLEYEKVYEVADLLGLDYDKVHFTNRAWKSDMIHELGIHLLVDDDAEDCFRVRQRFSIYNAVCIKKEANNDVTWRYGAEAMLRFYLKIYKD
tara:strand:+ start:22288 stop:22905 length:618 start_codon:yes stop_codon:yes gene_type:complete